MGQDQELERIKKIFWRRRAWFLWPLVSLLLLTAIICVVLPNIYKSTATVLILNQQIPTAIVPSTVTTYAQERIQAITQEVTSRSKILKLVEKYNLLPDKVKKLTTEELVDQIRKRISFQTINAEVNKDGGGPVNLTIAFSISYEDEDPGKAQAVTNEIVSFYLEKNLESREKVARGTTEFLTEQLKQEHTRIDDLQTKLADFQKEHLEELPEYSALNMQKLERQSQRLSDIGMQLSSLEEQQSILKGDQALLDPYSGSVASKVLTPSERLQQLKLERAQALSRYSASHPTVIAKDQEIALLQPEGKAGLGYDKTMDNLKAAETKLAGLKSTYTDKHPEVQSTEREIKRLKAELADLQNDHQPAGSKIASAPTSPAYITMKSELEKLAVSISSLQAEKKQLEKDTKDLLKKLHSMPQVAKQFNDMETEYQSAKFNYNAIEQKLLGARVSQGMEEEKKGESFQVVEPAFLPEKPAKPNRVAIMLAGAVLALGLSFGTAAAREFSDKRIHDLEVLQRISRFPVISIIPAIISEADIAAMRKRRLTLWVAGMCGVIAIILAVHFFVMDLDIVYAKLGRLVQKKIL